MDLKVFDLKFGHIISHAFPGLIFLFTLSLALVSDFTIPKFIEFLSSSGKENDLRASSVAVILVCASILGMVLDAVQHSIIDLIKNYFHPKSCYKIYSVKNLNKEKIEVYEKLFENQYYFYYEFYANISLSLIPLIFVPSKLLKEVPSLGVVFTMIPIVFLFYQAYKTYVESIECENKLSENL